VASGRENRRVEHAILSVERLWVSEDGGISRAEVRFFGDQWGATPIFRPIFSKGEDLREPAHVIFYEEELSGLEW
jgi:hypothetical protein